MSPFARMTVFIGVNTTILAAVLGDWRTMLAACSLTVSAYALAPR